MTRRVAAIVAAALFVACSGDDGTLDAGQIRRDAGRPDSGEIIIEFPDAGEVDGSVVVVPEVAWCNIQAPPSATIKLGGEVDVYGQVYVPGVTEAAGQGGGVVGQLGFGPQGSDPRSAQGWLWGNAGYNKDEGNHDEYQGTLAPSQPGTYAYAYKFRVGNAREVYCDVDGADFSPSMTGTLEVKPAGVDWCNLQFPPNSTIEAGGKLTAFGWVFLEGNTDQPGAGAELEGQLGYGPAGSNGSTSGDWTWAAASFNKDEGNNDEFMGEATPGLGSYGYAFRFRHRGGPWTFCDLDGSANGYAPDQQGALSVVETKPPVVDWCAVWFPGNATLTVSDTLEVYGQVLVSGVTDAAGAGVGVEGQIGVGPEGSNGSTDGAWSWSAAVYNTDEGDNDEFAGTLTATAEGTFAYAYRFRYQGGDWLYCDLDRASSAYDPAQQGSLSVQAVKPPAVDWCRLQIIPGSGTLTSGDTFTGFGQLFVAGVTDAAGAGPDVEGELGYGAAGSDGSSSASWTWVAAGFNLDVGAGNNDEYMASFTPAEGGYAYAYRFRYKSGDWLYCDTDGNTGAAGGFDPALQGALTVEPPLSPTVDFCNLQWPPSGDVGEGASFSAFGQVRKDGVTNQLGASADITGELGFGPAGTDGSTATGWTWSAASFNEDKPSNNDEYMGAVSPAVGSHAYAYRFRYQGGSWTYCDLDGSGNGFDVGQQGLLNVQAAPPPKVDWCRLQIVPGSGSISAGETFTGYGQALVVGVTEAAGQGAEVEGELGLGPAGSDASASADWSWTAAGYNLDHGNNDEYLAALTPVEGSYAYTYRFRYRGGDWLYCDTDGSDGAAGSFDPALLGALTVSAGDVPRVQLRPHSPVENVGAWFRVTGEVFRAGLTEAAGQAAGVSAEIGVGASGTTPDGSWQWRAAEYLEDATSDGRGVDVWGGWAVAMAANGTGYDVAMRFTVDGAAYLADLDGDTAYASSEAGKLVTYDEPEVGNNDIGWCNVQSPAATVTTVGQPTELIFGQVYVGGHTDPAGCSSRIASQLGWGPAGTDPRTAQWRWIDAPCNGASNPGNNDEHMATITPDAAGAHGYVYRVRMGMGWTYCDKDPGSTGRADFDPAQAGALTVNP